MSRLYKQIVMVMWGLSNYVEVIQADCDSYVGGGGGGGLSNYVEVIQASCGVRDDLKTCGGFGLMGD